MVVIDVTDLMIPTGRAIDRRASLVTHLAAHSLPCDTVVILARYCMMILVASVLPDPLSPLMMMDWFEAVAFLARTSAFVSDSASKCPFT